MDWSAIGRTDCLSSKVLLTTVVGEGGLDAAEPWRTGNMESLTLAPSPHPMRRGPRGSCNHKALRTRAGHQSLITSYQLQITSHDLLITCHQSSKSPPNSTQVQLSPPKHYNQPEIQSTWVNQTRLEGE